MSNTVTAYFKGRVGVAEALYQNDYGIVMAFDGIDLPAHFDCYFTVPGSDTAIPGVGADSRVAIPNAVLANSGNVVIHIPLHTGDSDSEVEYIVYFKVIGRARPEDDGAPVQMTAIERALALLQEPIGNIEEIVNEALSFTGTSFNDINNKLDNLIANSTPSQVTQLWSGTLTKEGDVATLSQSIADFDFVDVYVEYYDSDYLRKPVANGSAYFAIQSQNLDDNGANNYLQLWEKGLQLSGTTATVVKNVSFRWDDFSAPPVVTPNAQTGTNIIRIDGIKLVSDTIPELNDVRYGADGVTYNNAGNAVRTQLTDLKSDLNGSIENLDDGKLKIAPTFVFGTLDTNGDIVPFANNSRCSSVEYYTAKNGDVLTLDASFSMILCEYNASQTLVSRAVKVSGTYALTEGNLYRVCVFDPNGTIQDNPYQFAFKAHLQSKIYKRLDTINADIDAVDKKVSDTADSMIIVPVDPDAVYHNDGYINASTNAVTSIGTSAQYFYSDLISLHKGDVVKVEYRDTLDVVWILSQWTSAGVFVQGVLKGNDIASTVQSYQFTASEDMYIRHSARFLNSLTIKRVNSENAEMFADYLENETEYDYGFLLNSFLKIGGIGDSLASGECISGTQGGVTVANDLYEHSWLQYMARFYGFTGINFSKGGMTTRGWLFDADYNRQGWTKAQIAENKCNAYIIGLGANDMALMIEDASYLGSPSDIGTTNPTFYRYYAQIISRLKTIQPKAKFFLFTLTWLYTETPPYNAWVDRVNEAITYIANNTENCYLIDLDADRWYYGTDVTGNRRSGHYNAIGYNMQAMHLAKLIGKYIHDHQSEFRQIEFIGTDLSWNQ